MITIHCGTWKRVQDGARIEGPLVQHEGGKMSRCDKDRGRPCDCYQCSEVSKQPEQPQGDVIERMLDAAEIVVGDSWRSYCEEDQQNSRKAMTAAAKVCRDDRDAYWLKKIDEALGPVTIPDHGAINDESFDYLIERMFNMLTRGKDNWIREDLTRFLNNELAARRARILPESKPDAAVEAVMKTRLLGRASLDESEAK